METRFRRGKEVEIPPKWRNRITTRGTIRKRKQLRITRSAYSNKSQDRFVEMATLQDDGSPFPTTTFQTSTKRAVVYTWFREIFR